MHDTARPRGRFRRGIGLLFAALRQRCPRCRTGRMFRGSFTMNDPCPHCGMLFQREEGYFLGAMYFSYALSTAVITPLFFGLSALLADWDGTPVALLAIALYVPFVPAVFRYSRILWIYFDRALYPDDLAIGSFEKMRLREIETERAARGEDPP